MIQTAISDEVIKANIVEQLYWDSRVDASNISVAVKEGRVTLTGEVPYYVSAMAAVDSAWDVEGVTFVSNQMQVNYVDKLADDELKSNILSKLALNPYVLSHNFDVRVDHGWVTLDGTVDSQWKKLEAENDALGVHGIIGLTNRIAVVTTDDPKMHSVDASIAEDVIKAITRSRLVNIADVNVKVSDGKVILTGEVPSWEARKAAYRSALYTFGVAHVDNQITVKLPLP